MTETVNQPTANPTRKLWAVIIAGVITSMVSGGIEAACGAGIAPACAVPDLSGWLNMAILTVIVSLSGYMRKERREKPGQLQ